LSYQHHLPVQWQQRHLLECAFQQQVKNIQRESNAWFPEVIDLTSDEVIDLTSDEVIDLTSDKLQVCLSVAISIE